jgi:hypothetical protein
MSFDRRAGSLTGASVLAAGALIRARVQPAADVLFNTHRRDFGIEGLRFGRWRLGRLFGIFPAARDAAREQAPYCGRSQTIEFTPIDVRRFHDTLAIL